ncbi:Tetratricopeptide TPR_2 repeat protein [Anaeromyxobacter dehalogenans 2CP-1]|uniref:Tetratricopeptide TPR_2 repeat protein n=1 Tax=Anaeromyxobacter dehalogenans (strain ATCC BAA-258 / DSM 21875 / 2CP-1) TaxID=455488 RepID=B8J783_ANAD2|nr:tetratricopeptide repeat protein [Anaeromyxobacter dehalogenans]ACL65273.1 Tetratricopeptide TPR_2 repeat protein [Anaeromyxobacter dehalogenans 2CP-1]
MIRALLAAALAAAIALPAAARPAGISEAWYLARGRANLRIGNCAAAVEAYRKALAENPRSREASRGVALALLQNGDTDLAVAELDRHLARFPDDAELAFRQAGLLQWSRYAYRSKDAVRYLRMGLAVRDDPARRRELARLLARERATLGEALAEYDRLLAAAPDDRALRDERLRLLLWDPARREAAVEELRRRRREGPGDAAATRTLAGLLAADARTAGEAVGLYDELLARRPEDAELALGRARALAKAGRRAEARDAYARAIALRPSAEARLERAELLAADPATRDEARAEYQAVLRAEPRSRRARLGLARVLGARKETSGEAIAAYETVLASAPQDAEAHRGLAQAYAWNGDPDRALAHGDLAGRYGPVRPELAALERDLRRGREPAAGGLARALAQTGGDFAISSAGAFATGRTDPTPFTTGAVEAGAAAHRGPDGARAEGAQVRVTGRWRPDPAWRLDAAGGWDGARRAGQGFQGALGVEGSLGTATLAATVSRAPRLDSFRAYAGELVDGRVVGAASETAAAVRVALAGRDLRGELSARAGTVSGAGLRSTFLAGAAARADRVLARPGGFELSAGGAVEAVHHARDLSGDGPVADPAAPRLFSPPLHATASPRLTLARGDGLAGRLVLDAGPAVQLTTGPRGAVRAGGDARAAVFRRLGRIQLSAEARYGRLASVHTAFSGAVGAELLFP